MSMQDPISDMLTRIRNGQSARQREVVMPASKFKRALAKVLTDEGYLTGYHDAELDGKPALAVELKFFEGRPVIERIERTSKPSLRVYRSCADLPKVRGGLGVAVVSTSQGLMSDRAARAKGIGGEVVCTVY